MRTRIFSPGPWGAPGLLRLGLLTTLLTLAVVNGPRVEAAQEPARRSHPAVKGAAEAGEFTGGEPGAEEHQQGVPLAFKADLAFWSAITFLIFLFLLGRFAWKPLIAALDQREGRVRGDILAAESARAKAEQMLAEHSKRMAQVHEEIRALLAEARKDAEHVKQDILAQAQKESDAGRQRALNDISRARDSALKDLFDVMANEVAQATRHVLGRSVNAADQDRLIEEALAQFPRR